MLAVLSVLAETQPTPQECSRCALGSQLDVDCSLCPWVLDSADADRSCILRGADFGRAHEACGWAPMVAVADNSSIRDMMSRFDGVRIFDPTLNGAERCQQLCAGYEGCDYFSWEFEDGLMVCYMKAAYPEGSESCNVISPWKHSCGGDTGACAAGPAVCPPPPLSSIRALQETAGTEGGGHECYPSEAAGQWVRVRAYVSAVDEHGYYLQEAAAKWSGIYVYEPRDECVAAPPLPTPGLLAHAFGRSTTCTGCASSWLLACASR